MLYSVSIVFKGNIVRNGKVFMAEQSQKSKVFNFQRNCFRETMSESDVIRIMTMWLRKSKRIYVFQMFFLGMKEYLSGSKK